MFLRHPFCCFLFFLFSFCYSVKAQVKDYSQTIENILPVSAEDDFNETVSLFNELMNKEEFREKFWDPSFLKLFKQAKIWANSNGSKQDYLQAQFMLLMYYDNHLQDDEVILIAEELFEYPTFPETKNSAFTYQALYNSYGRLGYYRQQIEILNQLIKLNKKHGYPVRPETYENYNDLGLIYYKLEQYDLARSNFEKQAEIFEDSNDVIRYASMLNNIALTYKQQHENDSALHYYKLAIKRLGNQPIKDQYYSANYQQYFRNVILSNIAYLEIFQGKYEGAEDIFKKELASSKQVKIPSSIREGYAKLAQLYNMQAKYDQAKIYTDSVLSFEKKFPDPQAKADAKLMQAKLLLRNAKTDQGLAILDEVFRIKDSLTKVKAERAYSEATAKYNFVEAQNKLKRNVEVLQQKEKTNQVLIIFSISAVVAISIILLLFYKTKKSKILINHQKSKLAKGIIEKQKLLDEMHHRTKNNLQIVGGILELQTQKNMSSESIKLLQESQQYLESIAILHKMLYEQQNYEDIDLQTYLQELAGLIINNYPNNAIQYHITCQAVFLPVSLMTSLGLMICELLTNSLKHAFETDGKIFIEHHLFENKHHIIYRDDGKGFNPEIIEKNAGTGLKLITSLAEDLEGEIEFCNKKGFYFELKFEE